MTSLVQQSLLHWLVLHTTYIARLPQLLPAAAGNDTSKHQHNQGSQEPVLGPDKETNRQPVMHCCVCLY